MTSHDYLVRLSVGYGSAHFKQQNKVPLSSDFPELCEEYLQILNLLKQTVFEWNPRSGVLVVRK